METLPDKEEKKIEDIEELRKKWGEEIIKEKSEEKVESKEENVEDRKEKIEERREQIPNPVKKAAFVKPKKKKRDIEKFIGENLINKIGIGVLVLGIAYFVRYAIDKNGIG